VAFENERLVLENEAMGLKMSGLRGAEVLVMAFENKAMGCEV
jgi:hypothetical protein